MTIFSMMKKNSQVVIALALFGSYAFAGDQLMLNSGLISTKNIKMNLFEKTNQTEWIVQFKNHILESDKKSLTRLGVEIYSYLPEDALIVRATSQQISQIKMNPKLQAAIPFAAEMKLSPTLGSMKAFSANLRETYLVSLFKNTDANQIAQQLKALGSDVSIQTLSEAAIIFSTQRSNLNKIAAINGVESVQAYIQVQPLSFNLQNEIALPLAVSGDYSDINGYETGTKVMGFDAAWAMGLSGQNQIAGMADTGLDSGDSKAIHPDFQSAVKSGYAVGMFSKSWADPMGHGTHVAGSVLGRGTASKGLLKGGASSAQMVAQGMWSPILNNLSVPTNLAGMFNQAYADGARVHTNSWGAAANFGAYEKMAAAVDQVMFEKQDLLVLFAAGNSGVDKDKDGRIDPNSVGTPGTSKNALTVGASENLVFNGGNQKKIGELKASPESWPMPPMTESRMSDNINGLAMFSSRGPTADGRLKPEIVAPGTNILSVHSQQTGAEPLWGLYNNDYAWSGGTSMATPLTAAAAVITRQFLIEKMGQPSPSAAIVKALLMNTAHDMYPGQYGEVGATHGQELLTLRPNNDEGYGRVDLARMINAPATEAQFILDSKIGVGTGETNESTMSFKKSGQLQATLVWTDAPGAVSASKALVNDLDLEIVLPDGKVISKNDQINNNSYVTSPVQAGEIKIRVKGVNVPMGKNGKQPYAVVVNVH